ncbi:MAG: phospholipase D family protein [Lepagella sp.]
MQLSPKITKAVIGLHFYQTHPDFISAFYYNENVRFIIESHGVFHDKIYLFSNSAKDWCAIIGSSNFTKGGFENNSECNILISNSEDGRGAIYKTLIHRIDLTWKKSDSFTDKMLEDYKDCFIHQSGKIDSLGSIVKTKKRMFNSSELTLMPWDEYCALLRKMDRVKICIDVLSEIQSLFVEYPSYRDMDIDDRRKIAGFVGRNNKFAFFGTTKRNHHFGRLIECNSKEVSKAIDLIPSEGDATFDIYNRYVRIFLDKWNDPLATATRLLAMKRPDLFLCVNGKNKRLLAKYLNISPSNLTLENYWDLVIVPIRQSSWYNIQNPTQGKEYWKFKAALLDALIYEP